jgi:hypothetical protein
MVQCFQCEVVKLLKCISSHQKHKLHSETTTRVKILEWNYRLIVSITAFYTIEINGGNMLKQLKKIVASKVVKRMVEYRYNDDLT